MKEKRNKGITLIALVVTIVVLIILATISINIIFGEEGIVERAKQGKQEMANAQESEDSTLTEYGEKIEEYINSRRDQNSGTIYGMKVPEGKGTEKNPYIITEAYQLKMLAAVLNTEGLHIKLGNDIDLSKFCSDSISNWDSIGKVNAPFKGVFDGNGKTISNIYIKDDKLNASLFQYNEGIIKNLTVEGTITNTQNPAGIVAYNKGTIEYCTNSLNISNGSIGGAGGIVYENQGTIRRCINNGSIIASTTVNISFVGGIAAINKQTGIIEECINNSNQLKIYNATGGIVAKNNGAIKKCINLADISSYQAVGGIAGHNDEKSGQIYNCYNKGNITGYSYLGGIAGGNGWSSKSYIYNCYSINKNNIVGTTWNSAIYENCYTSNITAENLNNGIDDITKTESTESPWENDTSPNINDGYPILSWQK